MSGRPPGPIRKYTVENVWPTSPGRWRLCVEDVNETTAHRSAMTLRSMGYAHRIRVTFIRANQARDILDHIIASEWDGRGRCVASYDGEMRWPVPGWVLGEPAQQSLC